MNKMRGNADTTREGREKINEMQFEPGGFAPRSIATERNRKEKREEDGNVSRDQSRYYDGARDEQSFRTRGPHKGIDPFLFIS